MKKINLLAIASVLTAAATATVATPAHAFDISAMGGATVSNYTFDPNFSVDWGTSYIVGALIGQDFAPMIGFETGALVVARKVGSNGISATVTQLDIPLLIRLTPLSLIIVEAGGYLAPGLSTSGTFAGISSSGNAPKFDGGLRGVLGVRIPLVPKFSIRAQAQYSFGLANISDAGSQKTRAIDVLGGLTIEI